MKFCVYLNHPAPVGIWRLQIVKKIMETFLVIITEKLKILKNWEEKYLCSMQHFIWDM